MKPTILLLAGILMLALCAEGKSSRRVPANEPATLRVHDALFPAPYGAVRIGGYLGEKLDLCIDNRLMAQDIERLVQPFRDKPDGNWGFRSEFWGKWFTAAMMGYGYAPSAEHRATVDRAVRELMATQSADGYIGTYPDSCHLGDWDIWGRKYVLLGLLAYYDQTKETVALEAARRVADHLIAEAGPGSGTNIAATGWIGWKGLASCSVLEPITHLYQRTGEKRYLDFARHIVRSWDEPNRLAPAGLRLIQEAIGETAPWKMSGAPKAYEMMSCFEGLCELYRVTAEPLYLEAVQRLVDALVRDEIMIAGSGSVAEIWCHGAVRQSEPLYQGMETCVTATWMKLMYQMLRLTGDSRCADRLETSLYNALLGAMSPRGEWWAYYSGLMGERVHSHQQFPDVVMSCCVANGPRGLMITPSWAAMTGPDGVALNLYAPLQAEVATPDGQSLKIDMQTVYPADGRVRIAVGLPKSEAFALRLRIPQWSERTSLRINGAPYDGYLIPGTYASIERTWNEGDRIELDLDMRARVVDAPSGSGDRAIVRGPVVLAFDTRLIPRRDGVSEPPMYRYEFDCDADGYIDAMPTESPVSGVAMTFDVPCLDEAGGRHLLPMCDYASAGNSWQEGNLFRTWIPQPFDFRHLYINNLDWHTNVTVGVERPEIPELYRK